MFKQIMMELRQKDLEMQKLLNQMYACLQKLKFDFNTLTHFEVGGYDSMLRIDLIYYNRKISSFVIEFEEDEYSFKVKRIDQNTSDYNTNGDYLPVLADINRFEKELNTLISA